MLTRFCWLFVLFSSSISFLILCLVVISVSDKGIEVPNYDCGVVLSVSSIFVLCILRLCFLVPKRLGSLCLPDGLKTLLSLYNVLPCL